MYTYQLPSDCRAENTLPAATFPILDWIPAATDPPITPPLPKPMAPIYSVNKQCIIKVRKSILSTS